MRVLMTLYIASHRYVNMQIVYSWFLLVFLVGELKEARWNYF